VVLYLADRLSSKTRSMSDIGFRDAIVVGCAQAFALLPGVSRSGITLTAGLTLGFERAAAARFSFLLSAPIVFAAGLYKLRILARDPPTGAELLPFVVGIVTAAIVGALAISFLLRYLQYRSTAIFLWYRLAVGLGILALTFGGR
jgi:undecaprenyl-diphosphatase